MPMEIHHFIAEQWEKFSPPQPFSNTSADSNVWDFLIAILVSGSITAIVKTRAVILCIAYRAGQLGNEWKSTLTIFSAASQPPSFHENWNLTHLRLSIGALSVNVKKLLTTFPEYFCLLNEAKNSRLYQTGNNKGKKSKIRTFCKQLLVNCNI